MFQQWPRWASPLVSDSSATALTHPVNEERGSSRGHDRSAVVWPRHHVDVPVGVIDVGSNTVRLLVSENGRTVLSERAMLHLGAEVERHGEIPEEKLAQTAGV